MSKHTPGPWHVSSNVAARRNRGALETIIEMGPFGAFVVADASTSAAANARLIAAAPDLLEALNQVRMALESDVMPQNMDAVLDMVHKALAKAEGGAK